MPALTPAQLSERLLGDSDPQVSRWAARIDQRAASGQISLTREYGRLLAPFVDAGFVVDTGDGYLISLEGLRVVREMLNVDDREAVAA